MLPTILTTAEALVDVEPDAGFSTTAITRSIGQVLPLTSVLVELNRFDSRDSDGSVRPAEWIVEFDRSAGGSAAIHASEIPALIGTLTQMHRAWLYLDEANQA